MEYNKNKLITDDGANLVAQSLQEGKKVNFDSFIITDTPLPSDRQLSAMTIDNFKNARKYPVINLKKGKSSVQPEAKLDNNGLTEDYAIYAVGLLANISESNTVLFGITQNSEGTPAMLTKQTSTPYFITYDMGITVTNPDNYQATITPAGYVDQTTFDNKMDEIHTDIQNIDLSGAVNQANDYTDTKVNNLDTQTSNGISNLGKLIQPLLDVDGIKKDVSNRLLEYQKGLDGKQNDVSLSVKDNKLYYNGTPVLTATTPNQPKINVKLNGDTGNLAYQITPPDMDGGASITNYVISYRIITDENWQTLQVNGTTFNGEIAGIQKGQTYQAKVTATNMAGKSVDSETQQILAATEPSGVSIEVSSDYPNGVKYNINVSNNGGLDNLYYQIFYKKDTDNLWQFIDHPAKSGNLSDINIFNDNYQFKAKAGNFIGTSLESKAVSSLLDEEKITFDMPKAYTGDHYNAYAHTGILNSMEKPIFNFKDDVTTAIIEIDFEPFKYFFSTTNSFISNPTYASIMQPKVIIYPNEFSSDETVQLIPKMDIYAKKNAGYSDANFSLKLKRKQNSLIFINGKNQEGVDLNIQSAGVDGGSDIPCLNGIRIKYVRGLSND